MVQREQVPSLANTLHLLLCKQLLGQATIALEDVDGRIMVSLSQFTRQNKVTVENRTDGVCNRIVHVIPLHKHSKQAGDTPIFIIARALKQSGKLGEYRRRIPPR